MRLDDFIQGCWLQCDEWYFSFRYDQLWVLVATCKHERFEQVAPLFKVEQGVKILYDQVSNYHDEVKIYDNEAGSI